MRPGKCASLAASVLATVALAQSPPDLVAVPEPSLAGVGQEVRDAIGGGRARVDVLFAAANSPPDELSAAFGSLGRIYFAYQYVDAADAAFRNALELGADDFRWAYYLGLIAFEQRNMEEAAERFGSVLVGLPGDAPALLRLAEAQIEMGNLAAANTSLQRVLRDRDEAAAHYGLGRIALAQGRHQEAVRHFETTLEVQPTATRVHYLLARTHRRLGDATAAQRHAELYRPGEVVFEEPLLADLSRVATSAEFHVAAAGRAAAAGRHDFAEGEYRRALELDPGSTNAMTGLGALLESQEDFPGAQALYANGLELEPDSVFFHVALGRLHVRRGASTIARDHFQRALTADPANEEAGLRLAALIAAADPERALGLYDRVLAHHPQSRAALLERPKALERAGRIEEAIAELEIVVALMPEDPEARFALGTARMDGPSPADAAADLEAVAAGSAQPHLRARAHYNRGILASRSNDRDTALQHFAAATDLDPQLADAHFQLGSIEALEHRYAAAAIRFRTVLDLDPRHLQARLAEAAALALDGDWTAARDRLIEGIEVTPDAALRHSLARLLLEAPDASVRDPATALRLAQALFAQAQSIGHAETVALAYAETGDPAEAMRWQSRVLKEAESSGDAALISRVRSALESYRARLLESANRHE